MKIKLNYIIAIVFLIIQCGDNQNHINEEIVYSCPMHPNVTSKKIDDICNICNMKLIDLGNDNNKDLDLLLQATNKYVLSKIKLIKIEKQMQNIDYVFYGNTDYNTKNINNMTSIFSGRIEKLYIRSQYQHVNINQKIMDLYSPQLLADQQNLLFLIKNDPNNITMINTTKQKLLLLGMSSSQLENVIRRMKPDYTISLYSKYSGFVKNSIGIQSNMSNMNNNKNNNSESFLNLKEGMYITKGQRLFYIVNNKEAMALININVDKINEVKVGEKISIISDFYPNDTINSSINFIEPFIKNNKKTITARVYFNNTIHKLPIGSKIKSIYKTKSSQKYFLPEKAILSMGKNKIVFIEKNGTLMAKKIIAGTSINNMVEIISGLNTEDNIAENAQFLIDSDSFINIKKK